MKLTTPQNFPRRCASLGSLNAEFKQSAENFFVEEIPAYLPEGEGEHLYVRVRKQGWTTRGLLEHWAEVLSLHQKSFGSAGLKDKHATTTQWLSVHFGTDDMLLDMAPEGVEILEAKRHLNKLKTGHLQGNLFEVRVDGLEEGCLPLAQSMLDELARWGIPNSYGAQRMGRDGNNHEMGRGVVLGEVKLRRWKKKFMISAYQSALFNDLLAHRMNEGLLDTVLLGDRLKKHESGGMFVCDDPTVDQARADQFELSPSGPMFGYKMARPEGVPGEWETALLEREGLTLEQFRSCGKDALGTRRWLRVPLKQAECLYEAGQLILRFALPPGSYASVVLHELGISFRS